MNITKFKKIVDFKNYKQFVTSDYIGNSYIAFRKPYLMLECPKIFDRVEKEISENQKKEGYEVEKTLIDRVFNRVNDKNIYEIDYNFNYRYEDDCQELGIKTVDGTTWARLDFFDFYFKEQKRYKIFTNLDSIFITLDSKEPKKDVMYIFMSLK